MLILSPHTVCFDEWSAAKDESRELEQLRAKIVMEVSKDARSQTARAAKAVAAAREATMELDKVIFLSLLFGLFS